MFYLLFDLLVRETREGMSGQIEYLSGKKYLVRLAEGVARFTPFRCK